MFDVPPPERGVRGVGEYRATWPGFFEWIAFGAGFEVDELEVVAGGEVAYAFALLRGGERLVRHEHHSFTLAVG